MYVQRLWTIGFPDRQWGSSASNDDVVTRVLTSDACVNLQKHVDRRRNDGAADFNVRPQKVIAQDDDGQRYNSIYSYRTTYARVNYTISMFFLFPLYHSVPHTSFRCCRCPIPVVCNFWILFENHSRLSSVHCCLDLPLAWRLFSALLIYRIFSH